MLRRVFAEGVYCYGGRDGEGEILDTLKILVVDRKPNVWVYP